MGQTRYAYDRPGRLTKAEPDEALGLPQETYSYDAVGNRTASGHQPGVWSYNEANQLTCYPDAEPFGQMPAADTQVSYTAQGHTQRQQNERETKEYEYNAAERLIHYSRTGKGQNTSQVEAH